MKNGVFNFGLIFVVSWWLLACATTNQCNSNPGYSPVPTAPQFRTITKKPIVGFIVDGAIVAGQEADGKPIYIQLPEGHYVVTEEFVEWATQARGYVQAIEKWLGTNNVR